MTGGTDAGGSDSLTLQGIDSFGDLIFEMRVATAAIGKLIDTGNGNPTVNFNILVDRAVEKITFDFAKGEDKTYNTTWSNIGGSANDLIIPNPNSRLEYGGLGDDLIIGSSRQEMLIGGGGNDILRGNGGPDQLLGNGGNDTLFVAFGDGDKAYGGAGNDLFVITESVGALAKSVIFDFKLADDKIQFKGGQALNVTVTTAVGSTLTATKGSLVNTSPSKVYDVQIDHRGYVEFKNQSPTGEAHEGIADQSGGGLQILGLVGISTQQDLDTLMARFELWPA